MHQVGALSIPDDVVLKLVVYTLAAVCLLFAIAIRPRHAPPVGSVCPAPRAPGEVEGGGGGSASGGDLGRGSKAPTDPGGTFAESVPEARRPATVAPSWPIPQEKPSATPPTPSGYSPEGRI